MIARPTVVLPQPDSPTRPSVSPLCSWNEMPFTASHLADAAQEIPPNTGNLTTEILDVEEDLRRSSWWRAVRHGEAVPPCGYR